MSSSFALSIIKIIFSSCLIADSKYSRNIYGVFLGKFQKFSEQVVIRIKTDNTKATVHECSKQSLSLFPGENS